jgi:type IV pilus assembly protein PilA
MEFSRKQQPTAFLRPVLFLGIALTFFALVGRAQTERPADQSPDSLLQEINSKYPGLLSDIVHLLGRFQNEIHYPGPRSESHLLSFLPETTTIYAAIPNYGDAAHQAAEILHAELKDRTALRNWIWSNQEWTQLEPKIEDSLERFSQVQQYLGNEMVFCGSMAGRAAEFLVIAEVRKPGLKEYLQKSIEELSGKAKPGIRVLEPQQLDQEPSKGQKDELLVLVRPDFVVAASKITALRSFNTRLAQKAGHNATAFQERIRKEYTGGSTLLAAADLHKLLSQMPPIAQRETGPLQRNGFGDLQYLVWNRKSTEHENFGSAELSFISPRQGAAAWLANSKRLTTLDFVSPKTTMSATFVLRNPARMFDEIRTMAGQANRTFAALSQFESMLKVSLQDDVLASLDGEVTVELDGFGTATPGWRVIFGAKDSEHLKQTLNTLLAASPFAPQRFAQEGITYTSIEIPRGGPAASGESVPLIKVGFAFCDGHLIFGSGGDAVAEGVRLHRTGESLEKSQKLLSRLPAGHLLEASALIFQDPAAMWSLQLQRFSPELAKVAAQLLAQSTPAVTFFYADDTSIREASRSSGTDVATTLVVAAVAIPNLLRSRMAANEASAVSSLRTINTAEVTYGTAYPTIGFARALAKLGPNTADPDRPTAEHADVVDGSLTSQNCTPDGWCTKSGYRFNLKGVCKTNPCTEYVVTATPAEADRAGVRSFCSTSDGIIRMKLAAGALLAPLTVTECKKWEPVK